MTPAEEDRIIDSVLDALERVVDKSEGAVSIAVERLAEATEQLAQTERQCEAAEKNIRRIRKLDRSAGSRRLEAATLERDQIIEEVRTAIGRCADLLDRIKSMAEAHIDAVVALDEARDAAATRGLAGLCACDSAETRRLAVHALGDTGQAAVSEP